MKEHKNVEFFEKCLIVVIFTLLQHSSLIYRAQKITVTKRIIFLQSDYPVQIEEKLNNTKRLLQKSIFCSLYLIVTKNILLFSIVILIFLCIEKSCYHTFYYIFRSFSILRQSHAYFLLNLYNVFQQLLLQMT